MQIITNHRASLELVPDFPAQIEKLTRSENEVIQLSLPTGENPKVKDSDMLTLVEKISNTVRIRLGLNARTPEDEEVFLQILEADVNKYPELTCAEVLKALELGIDGKFDTDREIFFTSSKLCRWIDAYIRDKKQPAMSKLPQLKQPEFTMTTAQRIRCAADTANFYADERRRKEDHRVIGGAALYENLEALGIYQLTIERKKEMYAKAKARSPFAPEVEIKVDCQNIAYNIFISELVDFEMAVSESGKIVTAEEYFKEVFNIDSHE